MTHSSWKMRLVTGAPITSDFGNLCGYRVPVYYNDHRIFDPPRAIEI